MIITKQKYDGIATMTIQQKRDLRKSHPSGKGTLSGLADLDSPRVGYQSFNLIFLLRFTLFFVKFIKATLFEMKATL